MRGILYEPFRWVAVLTACLVTHLPGETVDPGDRGPEGQREAIAWWRAKIAKIDELPEDEAFDLLGECIRKIPRQNIFQIDEKWPVYQDARQQLLSIPGHAEYFARRIEEERAKSRDPLRDTVCYRRTQSWFETLGHLPSEETVNVLGRFVEHTADLISDQERFEWLKRTSGNRGLPYRPLSEFAMATLNELKIENGPRGIEPNSANPRGYPDYPAWRDWWSRVKAGKLSYKFEGDPRIYPTGTKAPPYGAPRRGPPGERDVRGAELAARQGTAAQATAESPLAAQARRLWPWIVGIATLTAAGLWWLKRRKPAPPITQSPPAGRNS